MVALYDVDLFWSEYPDCKCELMLFGDSEEEVIKEALSMSANFPLTKGTHKELPPPDIAKIVKVYHSTPPATSGE